MSAPSRCGVGRPATEPQQPASDTLSPRFTVFPCEWCDRCVGCPCITGDIEVRRARAQASVQHRQAVARARSSRALDRRKRAA